MFMLDRTPNSTAIDRVQRLMDLPPPVEHETEEELWLSGFEAWPPEITAKIGDYLDVYEFTELSEDEKAFLIYLVLEMVHQSRVSEHTPHWPRLFAIIRDEIDLHFPLICRWVHLTHSSTTQEGWLTPEELNPQLYKLVQEQKPNFHWNGTHFTRVSQ